MNGTGAVQIHLSALPTDADVVLCRMFDCLVGEQTAFMSR